MIKVFTTLEIMCPFREGIKADSPQCRQCSYFYRVGTATFFWCSHPAAEPEARLDRAEFQKPKRGRPKGSVAQKAKKRPNKGLKTKKR